MPPEPHEDATDVEKAEAWVRRGYWLIGHGQESSGVEALKRAVAADPGMARAWLPIGVVALRRGRPEDAVRAFEAALREPEALSVRDAEFAAFGTAIAEGDLKSMNEHCVSAPFDREFAELRRLAKASGAECVAPLAGSAPRGPGPPGGAAPRPRP
jgi:tetratricopeptide (TPR) repeat protein